MAPLNQVLFNDRLQSGPAIQQKTSTCTLWHKKYRGSGSILIPTCIRLQVLITEFRLPIQGLCKLFRLWACKSMGLHPYFANRPNLFTDSWQFVPLRREAS